MTATPTTTSVSRVILEHASRPQLVAVCCFAVGRHPWNICRRHNGSAVRPIGGHECHSVLVSCTTIPVALGHREPDSCGVHYS